MVAFLNLALSIATVTRHHDVCQAALFMQLLLASVANQDRFPSHHLLVIAAAVLSAQLIRRVACVAYCLHAAVGL